MNVLYLVWHKTLKAKTIGNTKGILKAQYKMSNLEALRAALRESQSSNNEQQKKTRGSGDKASFPFWDIPEGSSATVRFLPDGDETNDAFWVKREVIKLPFAGVVGGDFPTENDVTVTVPCIDMFGMKCPIIAATRHLWDKEETKDLARQYYKKRSFIFQGLVVNSPLDEGENAPENPIRRFVINKSIYDIIYEAILDPDLEEMPTDFDGGRDFTIKKTKKGDWANYSSSKFSMNTRSLSEEERSIIDVHGLFNLSEALGAVPSPEHIEAMKAMLKDSMDGLPFDMASYGEFYRPYGSNNSNRSSAPSQTASTQQVNTAQAAAEPTAPVAETNTKAADAKSVLDSLRMRTQQ